MLTKENLKEELRQRIRESYALELEDASAHELFFTLGNLVKAVYNDNWRETWKNYLKEEQKQAYYFSIEFLPGKMLKSNLLNLGLLDLVRDTLADLNVDLEDLADVEKDMALGNGGLGRLASCFMDSIASSGLPGNGNGIRYDYGLFKQQFVDGYQVELPDEWLKNGNVWEIRRPSKAVNVHFGGNVYMQKNAEGKLKPVAENEIILRAVPYDTGMVGYQNGIVNTMRLWSVEIPASEEGKYKSIEERRAYEDLTAVLYPDDSNERGRMTRLLQEYFFVSAGIQSIVRYYQKLNKPWHSLSEKIAVHINDTHPALCIPELMRILIDENDVSWEQAWDITVKVMSYTNHTILAEALEKWPIYLMKQIVPRMYQIIEEIDRRYVLSMSGIHPDELIQRTRIIQGDQVHMANLSIIGSHSTNGVAKLHSDLLKSVVLHDFYLIYPERFNNKTNGIAQRRWSQLANEPLSNVLDETIGKSWRKDSSNLKLLENFQNDERVLNKLAAAKLQKKEELTAYIEEVTGISVSPHAIFDVQIKRLHAYKRQLLNLMHILKLYFELKDNPELDIHPRVFIFGAKAAPSYTYAKAIIKVINATAELINNDASIQDKLKIVFLPNYNVTLAERIIPAADVSEQISLASKEASGTSNMKLMLNGAVTVATLDGANVEIRDAVGDENICIFGLTEEEVYAYYENHEYSSQQIYDENPVLQRVVNAFVDGTIPDIEYEGREIFDSLLRYNDEYFLLRDFDSYCQAQDRIDQTYKNQPLWQKISLMNIANAGRFSSDDTVRLYAEDIWQIEPIFAHTEKEGTSNVIHPF
ncbi:glycogen/starch/alpha-glucan phosphorylase [Enterococcus saccharolyticus]|uniref:Alpha-1,4 glucan phosphorylase n=1 Tax=Candidatus Enterococcus willemsii TaxID=1857215 RepID=A0ABQ6Z1Y1_9ENTE|nr:MULTISPECIES: glycogen/starch/alpha-glucan phosphorylase [Enterococcus]KAF1305258.1 glucan phosphorylase [Enterococcus sp. CU12B]MCD5002486.1 glycogen/starch/alpha-glucan phosphorylase [Enterococcus saccharolyticus]